MKAILVDNGFLIGYFVGIFVMLGLLFVNEGFRDDKAVDVPPTVDHMRCPEDSDLIVRYGVNPAGMWAFCLASDDVEVLLP